MGSWSPLSRIDTIKDTSNAFRLSTLDHSAGRKPHGFMTLTADKNREWWIREFIKAIDVFMMSVFPEHEIVVLPLPGVESTNTRILAGYLLHMKPRGNFTVVYGELAQIEKNHAVLMMYTRESCDYIIDNVTISSSVNVSSIRGIYCNIFELDQHRFCARTREERDIWLRSISNITTKLHLGVEYPGQKEFRVFRMAVLERVLERQPLPIADHALEESSAAPVIPRQPMPPPLQCTDVSPTNSFLDECTSCSDPLDQVEF